MRASMFGVKIVMLAVLLSGCSGGMMGGPARVEVRDGIAFGVFSKSGKEHKLGTVEGDQVKLYNMYGGETVSLGEIRQAISEIRADEIEDGREEQRALARVLSAKQFPGIWIVESAVVGGKPQPVREDDPSYLVLGADKTFQIVKKGRKPRGTWELNSSRQLVMNYAEMEPKTCQVTWKTDDSFELITTEGEQTIALVYRRTDLTEVPKAVDE